LRGFERSNWVEKEEGVAKKFRGKEGGRENEIRGMREGV